MVHHPTPQAVRRHSLRALEYLLQREAWHCVWGVEFQPCGLPPGWYRLGPLWQRPGVGSMAQEFGSRRCKAPWGEKFKEERDEEMKKEQPDEAKLKTQLHGSPPNLGEEAFEDIRGT